MIGLKLLFFLFFAFQFALSSTDADEDSYPQDSTITVNGIQINQAQIQMLTQLSGRPPVSGHYWYDSVSGLCGNMGQGASAIMQAGLNFGPLPRSASNGNTQILINRRELTAQEVFSLNQIIKGQMVPGSYWLTANGNIGIEGYGQPLGNLYVAMQQSQAASNYNTAWYGNSGGDNFWSSGRTGSAGNESGGTGYVSGDGFSVIYDK